MRAHLGHLSLHTARSSGLIGRGGTLKSSQCLTGVLPNSTDAQSLGVNSLLQGEPSPAALFHFPDGIRALFESALSSSSVTKRLGTPVTAVSNDGLLTFYGGQQQFDFVISSLRPEPAAAILSPPLSQALVTGHTGLVDLWIFNASVTQPGSVIGSKLLQPFIASSTSASLLDGSPSYVLRLDAGSPYVCVGAYVAANTTQASTTAGATSSLAAYGLDVSATVQYSRVQYPCILDNQPTYDAYGRVRLLGEAISGIGFLTALEFVPNKIAAWFG